MKFKSDDVTDTHIIFMNIDQNKHFQVICICVLLDRVGGDVRVSVPDGHLFVLWVFLRLGFLHSDRREVMETTQHYI